MEGWQKFRNLDDVNYEWPLTSLLFFSVWGRYFGPVQIETIQLAQKWRTLVYAESSIHQNETNEVERPSCIKSKKKQKQSWSTFYINCLALALPKILWYRSKDYGREAIYHFSSFWKASQQTKTMEKTQSWMCMLKKLKEQKKFSKWFLWYEKVLLYFPKHSCSDTLGFNDLFECARNWKKKRF